MPGVLFAEVNRDIESGEGGQGLMDWGLASARSWRWRGWSGAPSTSAKASRAEIASSDSGKHSLHPAASRPRATDAVAPLGWGTIDVRRASRSNIEFRRNRSTGLETPRKGAGTS